MTTLPRKERMILGGLSTIVAVGAMLLANPGDAHATPNPDDVTLFCQRLDDDASPRAVMAEVTKMRDAGLTKDEAGEIIDAAVASGCPDHADDVRAAAEFYSKKRLTKAV